MSAPPQSTLVSGKKRFKTTSVFSARLTTSTPTWPEIPKSNTLTKRPIAKNNTGSSAFENLLRKHHAVGLGFLSGLGVLLCYGAQQLKDYVDTKLSDVWDDDEYEDNDDEEALITKYHLNYKLNSKIYDDLITEDRPLYDCVEDECALAIALSAPDPRYRSAEQSLSQLPLLPAPRPEHYSLTVSNAMQNITLFSKLNDTSRYYVPLVGKNLQTKLSLNSFAREAHGLALSESTNKQHISKRGLHSPLDYQSLVSSMEQRYKKFHIDCMQVEKINFHRKLHNEITAFQHKCFVRNISWQTAMPLAKAHLSKTLLKEDPYALDQPMLAHAAMYSRLKRIDYSVHAEGGRFKAHKHTAQALTTHTQIRSASGKIYALLNELDEKDSQSLLAQCGIKKLGKFVLGEGMFGKVRVAQDLETGKMVAVKKMFSRRMANFEIEEFKGIPPDDHLVSLYNYAHVRTSDGDNKSYLFMELVGDVNGTALVSTLQARRQQGQQRIARKLLKESILECSVAVVKLHELGIYHCDIKPENFIISHKAIHLGDYGLSTKDKTTHPGSTLAYNPRDEQYDAEKHDAYALGITFFEFMHGGHPDDLGIDAKTENTESLAGKNLEECVAKLRDKDPNKRITVKEFLQLPYIQTLMSRKQRAAARDLIFFKEVGQTTNDERS
jgi:serine/threonine protein kinase